MHLPSPAGGCQTGFTCTDKWKYVYFSADGGAAINSFSQNVKRAGSSFANGSAFIVQRISQKVFEYLNL